MELVCRLLEVSRSGYYEWLGRKPSLRRQKDQELETPAAEPAPALSCPWAGQPVSPDPPAASCSRAHPPPDERDEHLPPRAGVPTKPRPTQDTRTPSRPISFARRFSFDKPDTAWVGDITLYPHRRGLALLRCCGKTFAQSRSSATPSPTASTQI